MQQLMNFSDGRLIQGCLYCGAIADTREHIPSRILLNKPFPENLPVMPACLECNNSYSMDEEYVACVINCMISGTTDPRLIRNQRVSKVLIRKPALRSQIEQSKFMERGKSKFKVDETRFENVIRKIAVGHAAFELSTVPRTEPTYLKWKLMSSMGEEELESFNSASVVGLLGEVGSRNTQRMLVVEALLQSPNGEMAKAQFVVNDWVDVQDDVYRYHASHAGEGVTIRIVLHEYIACEVRWEC